MGRKIAEEASINYEGTDNESDTGLVALISPDAMDSKEISTFETCLDTKPVNKGMYENVQIYEDDNDDRYVVDRTGRVDI